jgi:hypothetical protein
MRMESGVWRFDEPGAAVRFALSDPIFLKALEEHQLRQNGEMALWSVRSVVAAEKSYQSAQGVFACSLSALAAIDQEKGGRKRVYLYDSLLASGTKNGYTFAISECDTSHYHVAAEPEGPGSDQRAFGSDESGAVRASVDGKAATCLFWLEWGSLLGRPRSTCLSPKLVCRTKTLELADKRFQSR